MAIDGRWPYTLAIRDLASGCQLAWLPVLDETAETTITALQWLFLEQGPPLVLKSDNGSGSTAEATRQFLDQWKVQPLFSPPYTPEYNRSIEAGNGALETRTQDEAARQGRDGPCTADDAEAARRMANETIYPQRPLGPTRRECFRTSPPISLEARAAFGRTVLGAILGAIYRISLDCSLAGSLFSRRSWLWSWGLFLGSIVLGWLR